MVEYADFLYYSGTNTPIVGEPVTVKDAGTDTLSALFDSTGASISNPVYSDIHGGFSFYVNINTSHDIYVQGAKQKNFTSTNGTDKADKNNTILTSTDIGNSLQVLSTGMVKFFNGIQLGNTIWTPTATEINYLSGVTSPIQTQLNTLNYSSGTFTPSLSFGATPAAGYSSRQGQYIKIGNVVTGSLLVALSAKGAGTGFAILGLTGLPAVGGNNGLNGCYTTFYANMSGIVGSISGVMNLGGPNILLSMNGATNTPQLSEANFTNSSAFNFNFQYFTS